MERNSSRLMQPRTVGSRRIGLVVCLLYNSINICILFLDLSPASKKKKKLLTTNRPQTNIP